MKLIAFLTLHSHISISIQQKCRGSAVCWSLMIPPTLHTAPCLTFSVFLEAPSSSQVAASWARATDLFTPSPESFCHLLALLAANTSKSTMSAIASAQQHTSTPVTGDSVRQVHQNKHLFSKTNKEATISHLILGKFIHFLHFMWKRAFSCFTLYWR